jgi:hypothetical protein
MNAAITRMLEEYRSTLICGVLFPLIPLSGILAAHFAPLKAFPGLPEQKQKKAVWAVRLSIDTLCVTALVFGLLGLRDTIKDYEYLRRGEYIYDTVVVRQDYDEMDIGDSGSAAMIVKSLLTGGEFDLDFLPVPARRGDTFRVVYLPHTKIGAVIAKMEGGPVP